MFRNGWMTLKRNPAIAAQYVLLVGLLILIYFLLGEALGTFMPEEEEEPRPVWAAPVNLALQLLMVAAGSVLQAVLFAELGKEVDKPLWKSSGPRDALRRFFIVWFLINLIDLLLQNFLRMAVASESEEFFSMLIFLLLFYRAVAIPAGACAMYWGRPRWNELFDAFAPLYRRFAISGPIIFTAFLLYFVHFIASAAIAQGEGVVIVLEMLLLALPFLFFDLLLFAAAFHLCRLHRDLEVEEMTDPYDF